MDRLDSLLGAMYDLVVARGVTGPSLRAVANHAGISPAGVIQHFGSGAQLWGTATWRWVAHRESWATRVHDRASIVELLAQTPIEVSDQAFDFALAAIARGHADVARALTALREGERARLRRTLPDLGECDLDQLVAVVEGLRFAMSLPEDALPIARARAALQDFVEQRLT